ncbi:hypothetical protein UFOVP680_49, partial [uncultured Caudovirales phage]
SGVVVFDQQMTKFVMGVHIGSKAKGHGLATVARVLDRAAAAARRFFC